MSRGGQSIVGMHWNKYSTDDWISQLSGLRQQCIRSNLNKPVIGCQVAMHIILLEKHDSINNNRLYLLIAKHIPDAIASQDHELKRWS